MTGRHYLTSLIIGVILYAGWAWFFVATNMKHKHEVQEARALELAHPPKSLREYRLTHTTGVCSPTQDDLRDALRAAKEGQEALETAIKFSDTETFGPDTLIEVQRVDYSMSQVYLPHEKKVCWTPNICITGENP